MREIRLYVAYLQSLKRGADVLYELGFGGFFSIIDKPMTLEEAMKNGKELLRNEVFRIIKLYMVH